MRCPSSTSRFDLFAPGAHEPRTNHLDRRPLRLPLSLLQGRRSRQPLMAALTRHDHEIVYQVQKRLWFATMRVATSTIRSRLSGTWWQLLRLNPIHAHMPSSLVRT